MPRRDGCRCRAIGSVVERFVHTEEVTGSNPVSPTVTKGQVHPEPGRLALRRLPMSRATRQGARTRVGSATYRRTVSDVGAVEGLSVYPVKSLAGRAERAVQVTPAGLAGDRVWTVVDADTGERVTVKTTP